MYGWERSTTVWKQKRDLSTRSIQKLLVKKWKYWNYGQFRDSRPKWTLRRRPENDSRVAPSSRPRPQISHLWYWTGKVCFLFFGDIVCVLRVGSLSVKVSQYCIFKKTYLYTDTLAWQNWLQFDHRIRHRPHFLLVWRQQMSDRWKCGAFCLKIGD